MDPMMSDFRVIGRTVRRFSRLGCVAIKLNDGVTIKQGDKLRFEREACGMGGHGFHESTQEVLSIEVNHEPRRAVTAQNGLCAVRLPVLAGDQLPPCGCMVMVKNDHRSESRDPSPYMAKGGL